MNSKNHKLYEKLCTEYNDKGYYKLCSLHAFLETKERECKTPERAAQIREIIEFAKNDY